MDLAAVDVGQMFIEQRGQHADQPRLGLPAQSQQNEIVPRKHGVDDLRHNGIFVSDDAWEQRLSALQIADQVAAEFILYRSKCLLFFRERAAAQCAERARKVPGSGPSSPAPPCIAMAVHDCRDCNRGRILTCPRFLVYRRAFRYRALPFIV